MTKALMKALESMDKSNWKTCRFEEIAQSISERVDPTNTDLEIYVGLEHLDSEDIHIRRKGKREDVSGQKLRCYPGDIIFGRRRAYQRKAALVDFHGFCSAHSLVLRANPEVIDPKLFPFFLHSDVFMHRAVDISVGSLSPTINWGALKTQEFLLPPKEEQPRLAELLWAMDEVIEKEKSLMEKVIFQSDFYLDKSFKNGASLQGKSKKSDYGIIPNDWKIKKLSELGEFKNGINKDKKDFGFGNPFVGITDIFGYKEIFKKDFELVNASESEKELLNLLKGDVLFVRSSVKPSGVGLTTLVQEDLPETVYSGFIIRFRTNTEDLIHDFKKYCFHEKRFRYNLMRHSTISANTNINQESLKRLFIPIPPKEEQVLISQKMKVFEDLEKKLGKKILNSKSLQKSLINQIF